MKKLRSVWYLIVCILLYSCSRKGASDIFDRAEKYMEIYPDSALYLLNQLSHPETLSGQQRADYALLLTQARDKNYLDSLQSDSLIGFAVNYYRNSGDRVKAAKALFYYGKVMSMQDNDTIAMRVYLEAQEKLENTKEYKLQALLQHYIARLNDDRGRYDVALGHYRKSVYYSRMAGYTLGIVYSYRNIAWIHQIKHNIDSAGWYAKAGISLLEGDSLSPVYPSLLHFLGELEKKKGNYAEAITYFSSAIKCERIPHAIPYYCMSVGDAYMRMGQLKKAKEYFEKLLDSEDIFTRSGAYNYLYQCEKLEADYTKALYYKEKSDSLLRLYQDRNLRDKMSDLQHRHEVENLQMENKLLEYKTRSQFYLAAFLFCLLILSGLVSYSWIKKQYRRIYRKRLKAHVDKSLRIIKENERIIGQYIYQIEMLKQEEALIAETAKEQIARLNQRVQVLVSENKKIREDPCVGGIYILEQLKQNLLIAENMTQKEKSQVFAYMDLFYGDFVSRLKEEYGLNDNNLMLSILVKLGFSSTELMSVFQCKMNSILKKKQRLRSELSLDKSVDLAAFLTSFSCRMST